VHLATLVVFTSACSWIPRSVPRDYDLEDGEPPCDTGTLGGLLLVDLVPTTAGVVLAGVGLSEDGRSDAMFAPVAVIAGLSVAVVFGISAAIGGSKYARCANAQRRWNRLPESDRRRIDASRSDAVTRTAARERQRERLAVALTTALTQALADGGFHVHTQGSSIRVDVHSGAPQICTGTRWIEVVRERSSLLLANGIHTAACMWRGHKVQSIEIDPRPGPPRP